MRSFHEPVCAGAAETSAELCLCAYCKKPAEGNYGIHRDGFCEGPEVDLCDACGGSPAEVLSCEEIWARISHA